MINGSKEFKLLEDISFTRVSGSDEEDRAADIILKYLKEEGIEGHKETFDVCAFDGKDTTLEVLEPFQKNYEAVAYANSGETPIDGLEGELYYFEADNEVCKKNVKGKIALVNGMLSRVVYKAIIQSGAIGFIAFNGDIDKDVAVTDIDRKELRESLREFGVIPGVQIRVHDALDLVNLNATKVRFKSNQKEGKLTSRNVVVDMKGSEDTKERIVFSAHYDSVGYSTGAYDNGTGAVGIYALACYFAKHQPKRNLTFVFCGSEERGLLGSKAYCRDHKDELDDVVLNINIDMIGSILGKRIARVTGAEAVNTFVDYYAKIVGYPITSSCGVYSSDSTPFADNGIPAISFARITPSGGGSIHSRFDVLEHCNERYLSEDTEFICKFADTLANAYAFPIKKEMPQKMKEELDKYLGRDKEETK